MVSTRKQSLVEENSERFKALGHPVRLDILRFIVQGPEVGTPAGEIQERVGIPASTLSHHLACLSQAGLVEVEREGTTLRHRAHFKGLRALTEFLWEGCCSGERKDEARPRTCCGAKVRAPRSR